MPNPLWSYLASGAHRRGEPLALDGRQVVAADVQWALGELERDAPDLHRALVSLAKPRQMRPTVQALAGAACVDRRTYYKRRTQALRLLCDLLSRPEMA